jgi:subtilisin family serine protease
MRKYGLLLLIFTTVFCVHAQDEKTYMFRLLLAGKGQSAGAIDRPQQFLSQKAIDRRSRQGISVDETDLPIDTSYIRQIEAVGVDVVARSKWVQTVTVKARDSLLTDDLLSLPFVDALYPVYRGKALELQEEARPDSALTVVSETPHTNVYGEGFTQIALHNGNVLHEKGYRGEGMTIAVIDAGFYNADCIDAFDQDKILGIKNFSYTPQINPCRIPVNHGTQVLSCMLSDKSGIHTGTAPDAHYFLFVSEVDGEEFPVEEDFWISAIEYADSIGVDISTTSLGYTVFDMPETNHTHSQLDGQSVLISRAARMAAEKGILVLNAAGNDGGKDWETISIPSDADKIITVGAVQADSSLSTFTPAGPTADGRTKPDVVALGTGAAIVSGNGSLSRSNGTSFATPVMAGLTACLWQAFPALTSMELIDLLHRVSYRPDSDARWGFGIPDVFRAFEDSSTRLSGAKAREDFMIRHIGRYLLINADNDLLSSCRLTIYNVLGHRVEAAESLPYPSLDVSHLRAGLYIALLEGPGMYQTCKFTVR